GLGGAEERGRVAVGELAEYRVAGAVDTRAGPQAAVAAGKAQVVAVEAEPDADHGTIGQPGHRGRDGRVACLVHHERVVYGDLAGGGVDDRGLYERGGVRVRLVARRQ